MKLTVPGEPVPKARPRMGKGTWYTPRESLEFENLVAWSAVATGERFEPGVPLKIICDFYCTPRSAQQLPDLDNLVKSLLDGLQKGVMRDDRDVVALEAYRWQDHKPRTEVTVERVGDKRAVVPDTAG